MLAARSDITEAFVCSQKVRAPPSAVAYRTPGGRSQLATALGCGVPPLQGR